MVVADVNGRYGSALSNAPRKRNGDPAGRPFKSDDETSADNVKLRNFLDTIDNCEGFNYEYRICDGW